MTLLKAGNGTSTDSAANNLDTIAISGLTVKDTIMVIYWGFGSAGACDIQLRNDTDAVAFSMTAVRTGAGTGGQAVSHLNSDAQTTTRVFGLVYGEVNAIQATTVTYTTAWTSPWTLALRSFGISGGGTLNWSWSVYKIAGQ